MMPSKFPGDVLFLIAGAPQIQKLMTVMISQHEKFFPKTNDQTPEPASQSKDFKMGQLPRSSVGWDAAEESFSPSGDPPKYHGVKVFGAVKSVFFK